ncbi:hypothetical protein [Saccharothrix sp. HUAS TT1]|uniref:hypothetical protein n=1 Tax=unclassified Saccharothrix TaxID=2593673 RepID=UPI00345B6C2F
MSRRDITGVARALGVGVQRIVQLVHELTQQHGEATIVAEREEELGNHELTAQGVELLRDQVENSGAALIESLELTIRFVGLTGLRRDQVTLILYRYQLRVSVDSGAPCDVLFALDALTSPVIKATRWDPARIHLEVSGQFEGRQVEVSTTATGDEGRALDERLDWPEITGGYPSVSPTPDELRALVSTAVAS